MSDTVLSIHNLHKNYGKLQALNDLSLEVSRGQVFGLLGPNGSGKTTTLGIILNLLKAGSGSFRWFGQEPDDDTRKRIGSVIESPNFYPYLTAVINLQIIADIKGIGYDDIDHVLKITGLFERRNSRFKTFSFGMKQRLAIASALLGKPDVLILDEPTNGLDPQGIADIRNIIQMVAANGTTIILASHLLDEVQKICSHVAVLQKGKKLFDGKVSEVLAISDCIEIAAPDIERLQTIIRSHPALQSCTRQGEILEITMKDNIKAVDINSFCQNNGILLSHLAERKRSLEQHFLELLSDETP